MKRAQQSRGWRANPIWWVLLLLGLPATAIRADLIVDSQDLFVSGVGGYHTYRIPALARMPDGSLFAFAEGRVNSASDSGNIDIVMRRSFDNGATWSPVSVAVNLGFNTAGNPTPIVDAANGTLQLMFARNNTEAFVARYNFGTNQFNAATNITSTVKSLNVPFSVERLGPGPTAGIQLNSGRLLAPIWINETTGDDDEYRSAVLYSDDGGTTWQAGGVAPVPAAMAGSNEAAVAQLADGSLYMSLRANVGVPNRAGSVSNDGGITWSSAALAPQIDADMTAIKAGLVALGYPNDSLLLSAPQGPGRNDLALWLNVDKSATWTKIQEFGNQPAGYSELTKLSGGLAGLLYENGTSDYRERITWTRLDISGLPVPEPSSVALLLTLLIGMAFRFKVRRQSALLIMLLASALIQQQRAFANDDLSALPTIDISADSMRQVIVARGERDLFNGQPTTLLLPDQKTMFCVWTSKHGGACGPMKRSDDGGLTWSDLIAVPASWRQARNCPSIYRLVDPQGTPRLFVFAGQGADGTMHQSHSLDEGRTWTPMASNGLTAVMPFTTIELIDSGKALLAMTNIRRPGEKREKRSNVIAQSRSTDGGLTWSPLKIVHDLPGLKPCEPEIVRSSTGAQLLCLMRENVRHQSLHSLSDNDGRTWSAPKPLPPGLFGDLHAAKFTADGRLVVCFRDTGPNSPTKDHVVAWVGRYEDIVSGAAGQYRIKLLHSHDGNDCGYCGLERLADDTLVATTYVKYRPGPEKQSIVSVRFKLPEIDELAKSGAAR
jgi:hypothetical protein